MTQQKKLNADKGGSFVAIDKRMVAGDSEAVGRSEIREVRIAVGSQLLCSSECRRQQTGIAHAGRPAMLGELRFMHGVYNRLL